MIWFATAAGPSGWRYADSSIDTCGLYQFESALFNAFFLVTEDFEDED